MNGRTFFHTPRDGKQWGFTYPNGTSDGLQGELARETSDIGIADLFMMTYR